MIETTTTEAEIDRALAAARAKSKPVVTQTPSQWLFPVGGLGIALLGAATFATVRTPNAGMSAPTQTMASTTISRNADLPPPPQLAAASQPSSADATLPEQMSAQAPTKPTIVPTLEAPLERRSATPALIVDITTGERSQTGGDGSKSGVTAGTDKLSTNELFADRLSRNAPESVGTDRLTSTDLVVPQGTIITAVLETAINSDLPGLVRAVVSRDVAGFDGTKVLIPRGSRLIGQYSSGVALGQSRAFVIWTRVLRNDGVSVQLASAATDMLGTAGLGGKVDSHFMKRFGAATLLSVITGGLEYLANTAGGGSQVLVGNTSQANQLASIALQRQIDIAPTIKVAQGTPVRVFVARDLDFGMTREKKP